MEGAPEARDSRTRERPRDGDHRPERHRERDQRRERQRDRDHGPERHRERDQRPERQRDRDHGPERQRDRDHGPERHRERDQRPERQRDRDHGPERQRDRDHGPERHRERDQRPERQRDRDHGPERQRDRERRRDRNGDRPRDTERDRRGDRDGDKRGDRDRDRRDRWGEGDKRGDRDGDGRSERDHRLDGQSDWEHPRSNGQRVREKSRQSRTQDVAWDQARDRSLPPWAALGDPPEPWAPRKAVFGRPESDYPSGRSLPFSPRRDLEELEYYQSEAAGLLECHKCRYLCTGRGVAQIVEVILNGMVLMCIVASYFVLAGFSASFASSGFGNNYYSPFEGTELEQVRQLDQQYTVLRAPLVYGGLAVSLGLGVLTMGVLLQGAKSLEKLPRKWLIVEAVFSLLAAVGYCIGIGIFLHVALQINATDTCKKRERMYARNGLTWMNCQLAGTDGAAATFACLLVIMYGVSAVLAIRSYRQQQQYYKDSQKQRSMFQGPLEYWGSGTGTL